MLWLIKEDVAAAMTQALDAGLAPSAEASAEFIAKQEAAASDKPRNLSQAGDVAEISVHGVLTPTPSLFALIFGGGNTTYPAIQSALAMADADPTVKRAVLDVHSPGGTVDGLFDTLAAIQAFSKPLTVRASQASSAAYAIAAVAGKITAKHAAAEFGSIGVAATVLQVPEIVNITSTNAPKKRPDVSTDEGKAVVREYLDQIHDLFVEAIAAGRSTETATVNEEFGQGAVMLAAQAKKRGMIDVAPKPALRRVRAEDEPATEDHPHQPIAAAAASTPEKSMDLNKLKAEHRDLYDAVFELGRVEGESKERDRVTAHLTMGLKASGSELTGAVKTAVDAVKSGAGMTMTIQAEYMTAGMNRADRETNQADADAAAGAISGAPVVTETQDLGDLVVAQMEQTKGAQPTA